MRIEQLRREFALEVRWSVVPLHPETPGEGLTLAELFAGRMDVDAMLVRLGGVAAELDLPFGRRTHTYNSRRAQELGKWAEAKGRGEDFHQAVYRAYFVDGENIFRPGVLAGIADALGLGREEALLVLDEERFAAAVDADWRRAGQQGVAAVPTVICDGRQLVGFQGYEPFRELVASSSQPHS